MNRRRFLQWPVFTGAAVGWAAPDDPQYRAVSSYKPIPKPLDRPGHVVSVHSDKSFDETSRTADQKVVADMVSRGMMELTGASKPEEAWRRMFSPTDHVGIKVNCSGAPAIMSSPEIVAEVVKSLRGAGVPANRICIYERFEDQLRSVNYGKYLTDQVEIKAIEVPRGSVLHYDPKTYVEVNFFGEEDTRSNMIRMVSEQFTKIINIPNMKDHQASGVTGCLKNIAYGHFSNVARSHMNAKTHTKTFIGTLAAVEPARSKTVLHIMDGFRCVWHGGPFSTNPRFRFATKKLLFGTDPVAMDRILIDIIDGKRKAEGAVSVFDHSPSIITNRPGADPNKNRFVREPGHIEYGGTLGLGVYDRAKIQLKEIEL